MPENATQRLAVEMQNVRASVPNPFKRAKLELDARPWQRAAAADIRHDDTVYLASLVQQPWRKDLDRVASSYLLFRKFSHTTLDRPTVPPKDRGQNTDA
jgi:hypothetical protein